MDSDQVHLHTRLGSGPFVFSGVPPILSGELDLANASDEKVKLRTISVVDHLDEAAPKFGLHQLHVGARLQPKQRAAASAHFLVDQYTPPGTYHATVAVGDQRQPIIAHVLEKLDLRVEPGRICMRGAGGDVLNQQIVIANHGNVTE